MSRLNTNVSKGGKFKLYTVLNGLIFPTPTQPRISFEHAIISGVFFKFHLIVGVEELIVNALYRSFYLLSLLMYARRHWRVLEFTIKLIKILSGFRKIFRKNGK
jgi:hypothetical protein